jgi:hypothetical protein
MQNESNFASFRLEAKQFFKRNGRTLGSSNQRRGTLGAPATGAHLATGAVETGAAAMETCSQRRSSCERSSHVSTGLESISHGGRGQRLEQQHRDPQHGISSFRSFSHGAAARGAAVTRAATPAGAAGEQKRPA